MLESAFASISLSSMNDRGNRPPALSVSTISSIGEDLHHKGMLDFYNFPGSLHSMPSSPLSDAASARNHLYNSIGSAKNSPIAPGFRQEGSNTSTIYEPDGKGSGSQMSFSNTHSSLYSTSAQKQLPLNNSFQDFASFSKPRLSSSDPVDANGSAFGNWPQTNARSSHSLNNMDSVDENEQYIVNRSRAVSASDSAGFNRSSSSTGSFPQWTAEADDVNRNISSFSSSAYRSTTDSILPMPSYGSPIQTRARSVSHESGPYNPRQRVMSADSVHMNRISASSSAVNLGRAGMHTFHAHNTSDSVHMNRISASSSAINLGRADMHTFNAHNTSDSVHMNRISASSSAVNLGRADMHTFHASNTYGMQTGNRPRSFSSGHTPSYQSNPNYRMSPLGTSSITDANGAPLQPHHYNNGHVGDVNTHMNMQPHGNDLNHHHNNRIPSNSPGRNYMYEQQYRTQDAVYVNQDRMINAQQAQGYQNYGHHHHHHGMQATPRTVYTVKFKRSQKNFFLSDHIKGDIKIGSYVKVEADRGEDLGIVLSRIPIEKFNPGARLNSPNMGIPDLQLKRISRLASDQEISLLILKEEEEDELLKICRSKTLQRGLPMNVVDAEYQFDRHKLTFFFEASCRVDFRELVRDLFSIYKTRIWMQQIDKVPGSSLPISGSLDTVHSHDGYEESGVANRESLHSWGLEPPATDAAATYYGNN
jgi:hypothetical protein